MERGLVAVCIMTNGVGGTLYVGVTSDLYRRVSEHQAGVIPGFTKDHDLKRLVWSALPVWRDGPEQHG